MDIPTPSSLEFKNYNKKQPKSCFHRKRAARACLCCRTRKVRCNVMETGIPCYNCRTDKVACIVRQDRKSRKTSSKVEERERLDGCQTIGGGEFGRKEIIPNLEDEISRGYKEEIKNEIMTSCSASASQNFAFLGPEADRPVDYDGSSELRNQNHILQKDNSTNGLLPDLDGPASLACFPRTNFNASVPLLGSDSVQIPRSCACICHTPPSLNLLRGFAAIAVSTSRVLNTLLLQHEEQLQVCHNRKRNHLSENLLIESNTSASATTGTRPSNRTESGTPFIDLESLNCKLSKDNGFLASGNDGEGEYCTGFLDNSETAVGFMVCSQMDLNDSDKVLDEMMSYADEDFLTSGGAAAGILMA